MKCPNCSFANEADAKFCEQCGQALQRVCPNCGKPVSPVAQFCRNCGFRLETATAVTATAPVMATTPPEPTRLQAYIPSELLAKLETARANRSMQGERRVVTVLFCDVKGSTAMAEQLDPEEWVEIMNPAFEHLIEPVYRYEGTVARLMGDAILAFFGAPLAHEDDPQRAVMAGLEIVESIKAYRKQVKRERGLDFDVRVGINTGLVVVGEVGSDLKMEYTAMGDAVNLAARMEQTAQPGAVQISGNTHKLIAPLFECELLGGIEVKGKTEPVQAYRVLGPKAKPGRLRGIEGLDAPLIGRDKELSTLQHAMSELREGCGQIICVMGEAGLGKSRLIAEVGRWQMADGKPSSAASLYWSESRGISYDTTHPYFQFQQHIRHLCGASESDPSDAVREKIARILEIMPAEQRGRTGRVLEVLLAVEQSADDLTPSPSPARRGEQGERLEGEAFKNELFDVMLKTWRTIAVHSPTVMIFDDLHWADSASLDLLRHLFQLTDEVPILLLCAFRPDRQAPAWTLKQAAESDYPHRYREIALSPLSAEDSNRLVDNLLTISDLPARLRERILEKTEGNPFFVEEVVRTLIDSGAVVRAENGAAWRATAQGDDIAIPDNLQSLLIARIDRLEEDARRTLQLASVIGRSFYYRVLKMLSQMEAALDQQLRTLQKVDLIREAARVPELEYIFRHALTQEAAYNSILLKRRREFHRRVGETLETLFADRIEEYASMLGHHFYEAGDVRALRYYTLAGDAAYRLYANREAVAHYTLALEMARREPQMQSGDLQHLYTRRGRAMELIGQFDNAVANYEEMLNAAREQHDRAMELSALMARALVHSVFNSQHDPERAVVLCMQALSLARELGDRQAEARTHGILLLCQAGAGDPRDAIAHGLQSLAIARELNLRGQLAQTLNDLSWLYLTTGQLKEGSEVSREAQGLWRELGNLPMLSDSLNSSAIMLMLMADLDRAFALAEESLRISQSIENLWGISSSYVVQGYITHERGQVSAALRLREEGSRVSEQVQNISTWMALMAELAWLYAQYGDPQRGIKLAQQTIAIAESKLMGWLPWALGTLIRIHALRGSPTDIAAAESLMARGCTIDRVRPNFALPGVVVMQAPVELALAKGDWSAALTAADDFLGYLHNFNFRMFVPDALYLKGKALLAQGHSAEAHTLLAEARALAEAFNSRRTLWPILLLLSEIEGQRGNTAEADALRTQAGEIVTYISAHIDDADLRTSFLALVRVRAALNDEQPSTV